MSKSTDNEPVSCTGNSATAPIHTDFWGNQTVSSEDRPPESIAKTIGGMIAALAVVFGIIVAACVIFLLFMLNHLSEDLAEMGKAIGGVGEFARSAFLSLGNH